MLVLSVGSRELQFLQGDITKIAVDAIVNAANSQLAGGGGVDGAIHSAGGPEIMRELDVIRTRIGRCAAGGAVATGGGLLRVKFVFHAVGPIYRGGEKEEAAELESCYWTCLDMAAEREVESVSFPSISTGAYGYPVQAAAWIAVQTTLGWLNSHEGTVRVVKLVQFGNSDHRIYCDVARKLHPDAAGAASS